MCSRNKSNLSSRHEKLITWRQMPSDPRETRSLSHKQSKLIFWRISPAMRKRCWCHYYCRKKVSLAMSLNPSTSKAPPLDPIPTKLHSEAYFLGYSRERVEESSTLERSQQTGSSRRNNQIKEDCSLLGRYGGLLDALIRLSQPLHVSMAELWELSEQDDDLSLAD